MDATTLQPAAGAHGELTGMLIIHAFHKKHDAPRSKIIVPDTAHGTNPASAALCGYRPVPVASNDQGILSVETIAEVMDDDTAGIMMTNPNTLGLFEQNIRQITDIVHAKGGLVYCDGANMNAVMGIVDLKAIGVDVLHLNLHKTFAIPHGGGGPGVGPICVAPQLVDFLPGNPIISTGGSQAIPAISAAPWGSALACLISYAYIRMLGSEGLTEATRIAILNANYLKERLESGYPILYTGEMGRAAH